MTTLRCSAASRQGRKSSILGDNVVGGSSVVRAGVVTGNAVGPYGIT
ncbi:MAG: hypothetical protein WBB00_25075 [Mycobacterium sp.]